MSMKTLRHALARGTGLIAAAALFGMSAEVLALDAPTGLKIIDPSTPVTPTPTTGLPPLSWDDSRFASCRSSGPITLRSGASASLLSMNDQSGEPTITCIGGCNADHIRMTTREGPRCTSGAMNLSDMWIETKGQGADHADGLQCYGPNSTGTVTVKNTTFRSYSGSTHTGYFSADNWRGNHVFENVLFWGGNFGLRLNVDGGSSARLKDVYFVKGSFQITAYQIDIPITQWENVRWVTIENGKMVIGDAIPRPN